jgi:hypothetical protein
MSEEWSERFSAILPLALTEEWDIRRDGLPKIRADLRLAINSLARQRPNFWDNATVAVELVRRRGNSGVRKIMSRYSDTEIAFAIRDARK